MKANALPPIQFNFARFWFDKMKTLREKPAIAEALEELGGNYRNLGEMIFSDEKEHDEWLAERNLELNIFTSLVKVYDLDWLRENFENSSLYPLMEAIAAELYPKKTFETLEGEVDSYMVVTDRERSIVFDLQNFNKLPAGASLLLAGDDSFEPSEADISAANEYIEEKTARAKRAISIARGHLAQSHNKAEVLEFSEPIKN